MGGVTTLLAQANVIPEELAGFIDDDSFLEGGLGGVGIVASVNWSSFDDVAWADFFAKKEGEDMMQIMNYKFMRLNCTWKLAILWVLK